MTNQVLQKKSKLKNWLQPYAQFQFALAEKLQGQSITNGTNSISQKTHVMTLSLNIKLITNYLQDSQAIIINMAINK